MSDPINPNYYKFSNGTETIDITENLNFNGGNIVKYAVRSCRADGVTKADPIEDLKKVRFYVDREIQRREGTEEPAIRQWEWLRAEIKRIIRMQKEALEEITNFQGVVYTQKVIPPNSPEHYARQEIINELQMILDEEEDD